MVGKWHRQPFSLGLAVPHLPAPPVPEVQASVADVRALLLGRGAPLGWAPEMRPMKSHRLTEGLAGLFPCRHEQKVGVRNGTRGRPEPFGIRRIDRMVG